MTSAGRLLVGGDPWMSIANRDGLRVLRGYRLYRPSVAIARTRPLDDRTTIQFVQVAAEDLTSTTIIREIRSVAPDGTRKLLGPGAVVEAGSQIEVEIEVVVADQRRKLNRRVSAAIGVEHPSRVLGYLHIPWVTPQAQRDAVLLLDDYACTIERSGAVTARRHGLATMEAHLAKRLWPGMMLLARPRLIALREHASPVPRQYRVSGVDEATGRFVIAVGHEADHVVMRVDLERGVAIPDDWSLGEIAP